MKPGVRPGFQPKQIKREVQPNGWTSQRNCAVCGRRFFIIFSLIFPHGGSGKSKGEFRALRSAASTLILSAHGAGTRIVAYGLRGWTAPGLRPGPVFACGRESSPKKVIHNPLVHIVDARAFLPQFYITIRHTPSLYYISYSIFQISIHSYPKYAQSYQQMCTKIFGGTSMYFAGT